MKECNNIKELVELIRVYDSELDSLSGSHYDYAFDVDNDNSINIYSNKDNFSLNNDHIKSAVIATLNNNMEYFLDQLKKDLTFKIRMSVSELESNVASIKRNTLPPELNFEKPYTQCNYWQ